jgi:hypothetical protein
MEFNIRTNGNQSDWLPSNDRGLRRETQTDGVTL